MDPPDQAPCSHRLPTPPLMHPRLRLDLGWVDLFFVASAGLVAGGRQRRAERVAALFDPRDWAIATLSARSGFDLYLGALRLPPGSEVLVSGITIPHMVQILEAHGLRPVPFELDPATLAPAVGELERFATSRTRAILFAHLFGQRAELGSVATLARSRGWLLWEDAAQAYAGDPWRGEPETDLALFSFGLIKTATAVQGGIVCVRDPEVRARMREAHASQPAQGRLAFLGRSAKAALLLALSEPRAFRLLARVCARSGLDLDALLHRATRGFPGPDYLLRLRKRPSAPLLALLERRLRRPQTSMAGPRRAWGEELLAELGPHSAVVGRRARERHHWVLAVTTAEPALLVRALRSIGFDATDRSSLVAVHDAVGARSEASRRWLQRLVYVPLARGAGPAERAALVRILRADVTPRRDRVK